MQLCAIIGPGPVGRYVAAHLRQIAPNAKVLGLRDARDWLHPLFPDARFIASLQFEKCLAAFRSIGATEVLLAAEDYNSVFPTTPDALTELYLLRQGNVWRPYAFLRAIQKFLRDHEITVRSLVDCFPELRADVGFQAGMRNEYQPELDMAAVADYAKEQRLRKSSTAFIVSDGKVLMSQPGIERTDDLILTFGSSSERKAASFPVLCKISLGDLEKIVVPTIGEDTVRLCLANGIRGIVIEGGKNVLMQREAVIRLANEGSIYVCALHKGVLDSHSQPARLLTR